MAELPGWDRTRLGTAAEADVAAARWQIYARVVAPEVTVDYEAKIHDAEVAGMKGKQYDAVVADDRKKAIRAWRAAQPEQRRLRRLLLLDEADGELEEADA